MLTIRSFIQLGARSGVDSSSLESVLRLRVRVRSEYLWLEPGDRILRGLSLIEYLCGEWEGLPLFEDSLLSFFARRDSER